MTDSLAGLRDIELVLLLAYALAAGLALRAIASREVRLRAACALLAAGGAAAALAVASSDTRRLASRVARDRAAFALGVLLVAMAFGLVSLAWRRRRWPGIAAGGTALAMLVIAASRLVPLNAGFGAGLAPDARGDVVAELVLSGSPIAGTMHGASDGYLGLAEGKILRFEVDGARLRSREAASGLGQVRGLAVAGRKLYASEILSWPCPDPPTKKGLAVCLRDLVGPAKDEGEVRIIAESRARISTFDIAPDGSLGRRATVIDDLPVVSGEHAPNGLATGPDGKVYASIGGLDGLWQAPEKAAAIDRPNVGLLGTVVRLDDTPRIVARGLRNVYGLTFGADERLYGVNNDGPTKRGLLGEEVLHIVPGADYGYPDEGSSAPFTKRSQGPMWILDDVASAGIAWVDEPLPGPGLAVGSLNALRYLPLNVDGAVPVVVGKPEIVERGFGFRAVVLALGDGRLIAGGPGPLRLIRLR